MAKNPLSSLIQRFFKKQLSPRQLKWLMRLYPPLFFQGIKVLKIHDDFRGALIKVSKNLLNTNLQGSIFGGTLACAADPWYGVLFWQILKRHNIHAQVWVRVAELDFIKAATSSLYTQCIIPEEDVQQALQCLKQGEKFKKFYTMQFKDQSDELCFEARLLLIVLPS